MSSYLCIPNFNDLFERTISPIIINDIPYITLEDKKNFNDLILTTYETDVLSNIPTCSCGALQNGYNLGKLCEGPDGSLEKAHLTGCNTIVNYPAEGDIDLRTWLRAPDGMDGFIIPEVWAKLTRLMNKSGYNLLNWLTLSKDRPPRNITKDTAKRIEYLESINWPRGLNEFIRNFDAFIDILPILVKNDITDDCRLLRQVKHLAFPKYLPMPTKAMLIIENTHSGSYADNEAIYGAIDAARTIATLSTPKIKPLTPLQIEARTVRVINSLVNYHVAVINTSFLQKKGWFRGQLFSSRSHFCSRGVITSISIPHSYEEIHVPWAQGIELLKIHIVSKLRKRGYTKRYAYGLVESSGNMYNRLIDEIIQELIAEGPKIERIMPNVVDFVTLPTTGIACIFQRNPSLHRLSAQMFYITKVKTDLSDKTIGLSVLCTRGPNSDFDGDEMNLFLLMDEHIYEAGKMLRSHHGIFDSTHLGELSNVINLPDVNASVVANYLN